MKTRLRKMWTETFFLLLFKQLSTLNTKMSLQRKSLPCTHGIPCHNKWKFSLTLLNDDLFLLTGYKKCFSYCKFTAKNLYRTTSKFCCSRKTSWLDKFLLLVSMRWKVKIDNEWLWTIMNDYELLRTITK